MEAAELQLTADLGASSSKVTLTRAPGASMYHRCNRDKIDRSTTGANKLNTI